jgi:succinoglycan biosynthesis transport protein ExoP
MPDLQRESQQKEDPNPLQQRELVPLRNNRPALPASSGSDPDMDDDPSGVPLRHRLWVIRRNLWAICSLVVICTVATAIVSWRLTPIYEATATIDVDRRAPTGVIGQDAVAAASSDTDQFLTTQVRLIQSDSVLKPVVQSFKISKAPGSLGLANLKITRPNNTFLILITYRSPDPRRAADFVNAVAESYIEQTYNIRYRASASLATFMTRQIEELRAKMERSSGALATFEKELNMIRPEEINGIVSARLLQLNTEYTTAQGERVKKEAAFQSLKNGQLEAAEVSVQGEPLRRLVERLTDAKERFVDADRQYGDRHPEYKKAQDKVKALTADLDQAKAQVTRRAESEYREALNRESILKQQVADTKNEFDRLNARSFQYQNLRREAEADRKLYEELANRIKEAGINAGFQNSSIRLADPAEPSQSTVYPNIPENITIAFALSLVLGVAATLAADSMDATLRSTEDVERALGAHVVGVLPQVKKWEGGWLTAPEADLQKTSTNGVGPRATHQINSYEDAVLSLRNSILLSAFEHPLRSILVTSAAPAEGKTTTSAHLAIAHAQQSRRTLLIDCDLRRPGIRRAFNMPNSLGLSYALADESDWHLQLSKASGIPNLDILLAGNPSRRCADLVGRYVPQIIREATGEYDLIVVDAPPVLGFPEPLQLATAVDGVVLVSLAGKTNRKMVATAISTLSRLRANMIGIILNEVTNNNTVDYYAYGYYGRYGRYASQSERNEDHQN